MSSSRRDLTRAAEFAQEAVQLDATNPRAAIQAYGRSVALLSEVIGRVRSGQAQSTASRKEKVRRLQSIHDAYADRMNILALIHCAPNRT